MKPTHARRQGESSQGWGLSGGGTVVSRRGQGRGLGGSAGQVCTRWPHGEAGRACGRREGVGVPRHKLHSASEYSMSGRIPYTVSPTSALRSAQGGRASTAGLSPLSTPDSILMCYQKLGECFFRDPQEGKCDETP